MNTRLFYFILTIVISSSSLCYSQELGWKGEGIICSEDFYNSANWTPNASSGNECIVSADDSTLHVQFKMAEGAGKWVQFYFNFKSALTLSKFDIFGFDLKGTGCETTICHENLLLEVKFENGAKQAVFKRHGEKGILGVDRWIENLFIQKCDDDFEIPSGFNWDSVTALSFALITDPWNEVFDSDSGTIHIRNFIADSVGRWSRSSALESLTLPADTLQKIKKNAADFILSRQTAKGLLTTWEEDGLSYLYGQGMALKVLTIEGEWNDSFPQNNYAMGAQKLARFLAENQEPEGYWARSWESNTGEIRTPYESHDSSVWMGDFPWIIMGLNGYYRKTCDPEVVEALQKGEDFLLSLIDTVGGKFYTKNVITGRKIEVTSTEAFAAAIGALLQMGKDDYALKLIRYIDTNTWNTNLNYWNEGSSSDRVVLFSNTWLAQLLYDKGYKSKSLDALSFVGKTLYTRGAGDPCGLDGIGPIATWFEGTLTYICAGGSGSNMLMDNLLPYINSDGSVPHYNDDIGGVAGIWAEKWASLDGTCWLYFTASKISAFEKILQSDNCSSQSIKTYTSSTDMLKVLPIPASESLHVLWSDSDNAGLDFDIKDIHGRTVVKSLHKHFGGDATIDISSLSCGVYFLYGHIGTKKLVKKFIVN